VILNFTSFCVIYRWRELSSHLLGHSGTANRFNLVPWTEVWWLRDSAFGKYYHAETFDFCQPWHICGRCVGVPFPDCFEWVFPFGIFSTLMKTISVKKTLRWIPNTTRRNSSTWPQVRLLA